MIIECLTVMEAGDLHFALNKVLNDAELSFGKRYENCEVFTHSSLLCD